MPFAVSFAVSVVLLVATTTVDVVPVMLLSRAATTPSGGQKRSPAALVVCSRSFLSPRERRETPTPAVSHGRPPLFDVPS